MKYIINPYSQLIINNGKYELFAPPKKNLTTKIVFDEIHKDALLSLASSCWFTENELVEMVGVENTHIMIDKEIVIDSLPEENSPFSRTKQFYKQHLSDVQFEKITNSNILILGCGGIGSSIAWLLAGLGIKHITIVDFDIIEKSNLNRMFIFDELDVGQKKVDIVKRKIEKLYPKTNVLAIDKRISSEKDLIDICKSQEFNLVIKALDSPIAFPTWLDSVCKFLKLKYVGGITLRDRILVGPSFIPDIAENGWSDIIKTESNTEHLYGKTPSIGLMLVHATNLIATEAIKILIENYDACEFKNCIYSENIFTGEKEVIQNKKTNFKKDGIKKTNSLLNILVIIGFGLSSLYNSWFMLVSLLLTIVMPFLSYYGEKNILLQTFINSSIFSLFIGVLLTKTMGFDILSMLFVYIVITSIICLTNVFMNCCVLKVIQNILNKKN